MLLTLLAMIAFAANSVLCRLALGAGHIDAASFASVRVISGALALAAIVIYRSDGRVERDANWRSALALFVYMVFFSFAYLSLGAGTGALILFAAVQLTMFIVALRTNSFFQRATATPTSRPGKRSTPPRPYSGSAPSPSSSSGLRSCSWSKTANSTFTRT